ncbi:DUF4432 family protein [Nocardioides sp. NPDC092400]|uniref:DUF4432 family protein n=1 Tax=Nocardioides sp. NPDC092400 TaxID=3155196 RepID=UPI00341977D7
MTSTLTPRDGIERGYAAPGDDLVAVRQEAITDGAARGSRTITVQPAGGLTTRILLDRGMDLGGAWYAGQPVAWRSAVGESGPGRVDSAGGWLDQWEGGLLTTCGLRNVGFPSEGHGQHGSFTDLRAREVSVTRRWLEDGHAAVEITGTLDDASSLGSYLRLRRRITLRSGAGAVTVEDVTTNLGPEPEQAPILYHVNFGFPFLGPGSEYRIPGVTRSTADGHEVPLSRWQRMGDACVGGSDRIVEHDLAAGSGGLAQLTGPSSGLVADVTWDRTTMPRLHTWQRTQRGSFVASVEPANCGLGGREADRADGRAPVLEPGAERLTRIEVTIRPEQPTG